MEGPLSFKMTQWSCYCIGESVCYRLEKGNFIGTWRWRTTLIKSERCYWMFASFYRKYNTFSNRESEQQHRIMTFAEFPNDPLLLTLVLTISTNMLQPRSQGLFHARRREVRGFMLPWHLYSWIACPYWLESWKVSPFSWTKWPEIGPLFSWERPLTEIYTCVCNAVFIKARRENENKTLDLQNIFNNKPGKPT